MFANLTNGLDFQAKALVVRAERQRVLASNIANADTPGYVARDMDFASALRDAVAGPGAKTVGAGGNTRLALATSGEGGGKANKCRREGIAKTVCELGP